MPGDRIGRAVLELTTDSRSFFSDVDQAEKRTVTLAGAFTRAKPPLDAMARGMSDAGKAASDSSKLISGMSVSGRSELERLAGATVKPGDGFRNLAKEVLGTNKEIGLLPGVLQKVGPALAAALSVGAVVGFAKSIGSLAGRFTDLSAETRVGTEDLQAWNFVAAGVGLTVEDVTSAMAQLSRRAASGDDSAAAALDKIGLSIYQIQQQKPDEAFISISRAIGQIENPMERTRIAMDLFGRSGSRMLRLMTDDVEGLIAAAKESGAVIDEELIAKAPHCGTGDELPGAVRSIRRPAETAARAARGVVGGSRGAASLMT